MKIVVTYCSGPKRKDGGLLPAVDRYLSERIRTLHQQANADEFRILSGKFGLLAADQPIPLYDHLLSPEEVGGLAQKVATCLTDLQADEVEYHTADPARFPDLVPYREVIETACRVVEINLEVILLSGNPD